MNATDAKRIRAIADRVERINEEIAGLNADKREIFAEAREAEYDVKALKAAIKIRQQKANDSAGFQEHEHLVELYLNALDSPEETGHARAPAPRTRDRPPPTQAMGIAVDPDPNVTIINETPAPGSFVAAGGATPSPSTSAQPLANEDVRPTTSDTQGVAQPGSAPGLEPGGRRFESSRPDQSDDGLDIPTFMKRDANNRAPWMEAAD